MNPPPEPHPAPSQPVPPPWPPPQPWKACLHFALSLSVLVAMVWGGAFAWLRWYGPSLQGVTLVAHRENDRAGHADIAELAERLDRRDIYTFRELVAETDRLASKAASADVRQLTSLAMAMAALAGVLLILKVARDWRADCRRTLPAHSFIGITDTHGAFFRLGATLPSLSRAPLAGAKNTLSLGPPPLSPLAQALLECYLAVPNWPALPTDAGGRAHGNATLLQHVLTVRERALALAQAHGLPPQLAELAALGHDLGKRVAYRREQGEWTRLVGTHDRLSGILLASLLEWTTLSSDDQADLTVAIAFHHRPDQRPHTASPRATSLLTLLREADGLATADESTPALQSSPSLDPLLPLADTSAPLPPSVFTSTPSSPPAQMVSDRLRDALTVVVSVLRINTRPFDGRADPEHGILMLLNHGLRDALSVQLSLDDQRAIGLDAASDSDESPAASHPSHVPIAAAFRELGWLIETWNGQAGLLWDVTIGRRRWRHVWLLKLDRMPPALQAKWGRSIWPITVIGPSQAASNESSAPPPPGAPVPESSLMAQHGRVTPGSLLALAIAGLGVWFAMQPHEQRVALTCRPVQFIQRWMFVPEIDTDPWAVRMNSAFDFFTGRCPESLGARASELAQQANTTVAQAARRASDKAGSLSHRRVEAIIDGERLIVEGLGESRLLGVRVRSDAEDHAIAYLRHVALGHRFAVELATDIDPERRPLITLTSADNTLLNAELIHHRLATPWPRPGPWLHW